MWVYLLEGLLTLWSSSKQKSDVYTYLLIGIAIFSRVLMVSIAFLILPDNMLVFLGVLLTYVISVAYSALCCALCKTVIIRQLQKQMKQQEEEAEKETK